MASSRFSGMRKESWYRKDEIAAARSCAKAAGTPGASDGSGGAAEAIKAHKKAHGIIALVCPRTEAMSKNKSNAAGPRGQWRCLARRFMAPPVLPQAR